MKPLSLSVIAAGSVLALTASTAFASTMPSTLSGKKEISVNDKAISNPYARVAQNTTYMPIWYVGQALEHLTGVKQSWNGITHTWNITIPSALLGSLNQITGQIAPGSGNTTIEVNGSPVKKVDTFAATDPASNRPTVYMPIFYVQQIITSLGIVNTWDGTDWNITPLAALPASLPSLPGTNQSSTNSTSSSGTSTTNATGSVLGQVTNTVGNTVGQLANTASTLNHTGG